MRLPARLIPPDRLGRDEHKGDRGLHEDFRGNSRGDKSRSRARIAKTNKYNKDRWNIKKGAEEIRNVIE